MKLPPPIQQPFNFTQEQIDELRKISESRKKSMEEKKIRVRTYEKNAEFYNLPIDHPHIMTEWGFKKVVTDPDGNQRLIGDLLAVDTEMTQEEFEQYKKKQEEEYGRERF
jgi:hypothetical protein